jgi:hypothetical protein
LLSTGRHTRGQASSVAPLYNFPSRTLDLLPAFLNASAPSQCAALQTISRARIEPEGTGSLKEPFTPMRHFFYMTTAMAATLVLAACAGPRTRFPVQRYVPVNRAAQPLGELDLSNTLMRLAALDGEMKLQYVGRMPDAAGEELAGSAVYRVKNWDRYFRQNAGRSGYCGEAPRWVAWSSEISIALLTLEQWSEFSPAMHRSCAAGTYVRSRD